MKHELAEASAEKLRNDNRVESAEAKVNEKGPYVEVEATDVMAARDLKSELSAYPVWVEVKA